MTAHSNAAGLAGNEWGIDKPVEQFIKFSYNGKLSGFSGCNNFFGLYTPKEASNESEGTIKIGPLAATRKGCIPSVMKAEFEFLKQLENVRSYKRSSHHLELFNDKGKRLLHRRWRDFD